MRMITIILLTYLLLYILFLLSFNLTFSNKKWIREIKYTGLLWVALDHYSIHKYQSKDKPINWINYTKVLKKS